MGLRSLKDFNFSYEKSLITEILRKEKIEKNERIDWEKFLNILISEDIYPIFYKFFLNRKELIPESFFKILEILYEKNKDRVLFLKERTIYILKKLMENNIIAIPLRGFLLSERVYEDLFSRSFNDIDIFVFERDLFKAIDILKNEGFYFDLDEKRENFLKKIHFRLYNEYRLYKENFLVEIHFDILPKRFKKIKNFEKFFEFENLDLNGLKIYIFSKEWEIILLSIHSFLHKYSLLKFLFDIHKFILKFKKEIDFYKVYEISKILHILKIVKLSLTLTNFIFETDLPSFLKFKNLPIFLKDFVLKEKEAYGFKKDLLPLIFIESFPQKIYHTLSLLNPDENVLNFILLPEPLFFLYYPVRIFLIIKNRLFDFLFLKTLKFFCF
ncbi:MAG: nucleotidyltransferase family protein [candidate division WOR-3 bacterium]